MLIAILVLLCCGPVRGLAGNDPLSEVQSLAKLPAAEGGPRLVKYLGDENKMVADAAFRGIIAQMDALTDNDEPPDSGTIKALVKETAYGNQQAKTKAGLVLSSNPEALKDDGLGDLGKDAILEAAKNLGADGIDLLNLLASSGEKDALPLLFAELDSALERKDACDASNTFIGIKILAKAQDAILSEAQQLILAKAAEANIQCGCEPIVADEAGEVKAVYESKALPVE